jgi:hypothetical protein
MPREPDVLRVTHETVLLEDLAGRDGHLPHRVEGHTGLRVEIHPQLVGMVDVAASHRPRVQVDAAEIDGPHDVGEVDRAELAGKKTLSGFDSRTVRPATSSSSERVAIRPTLPTLPGAVGPICRVSAEVRGQSPRYTWAVRSSELRLRRQKRCRCPLGGRSAWA